MSDGRKEVVIPLDDLVDLLRITQYYSEVLKEAYNTLLGAQEKLNDILVQSEKLIKVPSEKNFGIEALNLCPRTYNAMVRGRIYTISDVLNLPKIKFYMLRNFGKASACELESAMHKLGYEDFLIDYNPNKSTP